jgi:hypothetical protein
MMTWVTQWIMVGVRMMSKRGKIKTTRNHYRYRRNNSENK